MAVNAKQTKHTTITTDRSVPLSSHMLLRRESVVMTAAVLSVAKAASGHPNRSYDYLVYLLKSIVR